MKTRDAASNSLRSPSHGITNPPSPPKQIRRDHPGPDNLPHDRRPPFPPTAQIDELLRKSLALDVRTRDTERRVVFCAGEPHAQAEGKLEDHPNADEDHDLVNILHIAKTAEPGGLRAVAARVALGPREATVDVLLLQLRNVQEATVCRLEKGDAKGKVNAHGKVLNVIGEHRRQSTTNGIYDLRETPVDMKKRDGRNGKRQTTVSKDGTLAVEPTEDHARQHNCRPDGAEAHVEDTHAVEQRRSGRHVVDGEVREDLRRYGVHVHGCERREAAQGVKLSRRTREREERRDWNG